MDWAGYFLCILVFVGVKQYFDQKRIQDNQQKVSMPDIVKVVLQM